MSRCIEYFTRRWRRRAAADRDMLEQKDEESPEKFVGVQPQETLTLHPDLSSLGQELHEPDAEQTPTEEGTPATVRDHMQSSEDEDVLEERLQGYRRRMSRRGRLGLPKAAWLGSSERVNADLPPSFFQRLVNCP